MLEVSRMDTYRGAAQILHGVSLSVGPQEVVCLVGRNGAGKTTTIDSIMGLLATRSGTVRFEAQDITALPPKERARRGIGYAPEDCGIFPDLTVAQNLMIAKRLSPRARGNGGPIGARHEDRALSIF